MIVPVHDNCDCCMCLSMKHLAMYSDLIEVPARRETVGSMFAAIYTDSDDCSYSFERVLGIFSSRSKAEEAISDEIESAYPKGYFKRKKYEVVPIVIDCLWS